MTSTLACLRRRLVLAAGLLLLGCARSPGLRWVRLRPERPAAAGSGAASPGTGGVWELAAEVAMPEYLDRDALVVAAGAGLRPLAGYRWAEPLRDSVPRLLRHDLQQLRGAGLVWAAPAPAGVTVERRVRVELLELQAGSDRQVLSLRARWWLIEPRGQSAPWTGQLELELPLAAATAEDIADAHRLALWRLAEAIAATAAT
jgi:uncharacterized lipoprotein YmbA